MTWPVYTKQLGFLSGATQQVDFPVPAGKVWVVTDMIAVILDETKVGDLIIASSAGTRMWWVHSVAGATDASHFWASKTVIPAGQNLICAIAAGTWDWMAVGYELNAV